MNSKIRPTMTPEGLLVMYYEARDKAREAGKALGEALNTPNQFLSGYRPSWRIDERVEEMLNDLRQGVWRELVNLTGIKRVMSVARLQAFDRFLEGSVRYGCPEVSLEALYKMVETNNLATLFVETIREAFKYLRPGAYEWNKLKTNFKYARDAVGRKLIITGVFFNGGMCINDTHEQSLRQVDKIFHLLDGKPMPITGRYDSPLLDALVEKSNTGGTEYFAFKMYSNNNLHLQFLREDLLKQFNLIAAGFEKPALPD